MKFDRDFAVRKWGAVAVGVGMIGWCECLSAVQQFFVAQVAVGVGMIGWCECLSAVQQFCVAQVAVGVGLIGWCDGPTLNLFLLERGCSGRWIDWLVRYANSHIVEKLRSPADTTRTNCVHYFGRIENISAMHPTHILNA